MINRTLLPVRNNKNPAKLGTVQVLIDPIAKIDSFMIHRPISQFCISISNTSEVPIYCHPPPFPTNC